MEKVTIEGYVGKPKGMKQVLWERGLWKDDGSMVVGDAKEQLQSCTDFSNEKGALEDMVSSRGHVLMMSPKGHPELAGVGVEYSWGKSKMHYRRNNDCVPAHLHANIVGALDSDTVLPLWRIRRFARKARDYRCAYKCDDTQSHSAIEKLRKVHKCHRCTLDQDFKFISET